MFNPFLSFAADSIDKFLIIVKYLYKKTIDLIFSSHLKDKTCVLVSDIPWKKIQKILKEEGRA